MKKIIIALTVFVVTSMTILYQPNETSANGVLVRIGKEVGEEVFEAIAKKSGMELTETASQKAYRRWQMDLYKQADSTNPAVSEPAKRVINEINAIEKTELPPVKGKPNVSKVVLSTAAFLTGADLAFDVYDYFKSQQEANIKAEIYATYAEAMADPNNMTMGWGFYVDYFYSTDKSMKWGRVRKTADNSPYTETTNQAKVAWFVYDSASSYDYIFKLHYISPTGTAYVQEFRIAKTYYTSPPNSTTGDYRRLVPLVPSDVPTVQPLPWTPSTNPNFNPNEIPQEYAQTIPLEVPTISTEPVEVPINEPITDLTNVPQPDIEPEPEPNPDDGTDPVTPPDGDTPGILQGLWDWLKDILQKILDAILAIPTHLINIWETLKNLHNAIATAISVVFIPQPDFMENTFKDIKASFDLKLPLIGQLFGFFEDIKNASIHGVLPEFKFTVPEDYGGGTYNLLDFSFYQDYREWILNFIRFTAWYLFLRRLYNRVPRMVY